MAAPKATTLSRTESIAQVVNRRWCCAGWSALGEHGSGCAVFASRGRATAGEAVGDDASRSCVTACSECGVAGASGRAVAAADGT
eukprot:4034497-Pleurochrysis_carterae.AAC.1